MSDSEAGNDLVGQTSTDDEAGIGCATTAPSLTDGDFRHLPDAWLWGTGDEDYRRGFVHGLLCEETAGGPPGSLRYIEGLDDGWRARLAVGPAGVRELVIDAAGGLVMPRGTLADRVAELANRRHGCGSFEAASAQTLLMPFVESVRLMAQHTSKGDLTMNGSDSRVVAARRASRPNGTRRRVGRC